MKFSNLEPQNNAIFEDHCYAPSALPTDPACSSPHGSDGSTPSSSSATIDSDYGSLANHSPNGTYTYDPNYAIPTVYDSNYGTQQNTFAVNQQKPEGRARQGQKRAATSRLQAQPRGKLRFG